MGDQWATEWAPHTLRKNDLCRVLPSIPRKRDGGIATFSRALLNDGVVVKVEVYLDPGGLRLVDPERVEWTPQPSREAKGKGK